MKRTLASLVQSSEEETEINVFTGKPDEDMDIISTDGETVVSACLADNFKTSFQQIANLQISMRQYDKHAALLTTEHQMKEGYSLQRTHHAINTLYGNDKFLFCSDMHKHATLNSNEVFRMQSRLQDIPSRVTSQKEIMVIPVTMLIETMNTAGLFFDIASKKMSHYSTPSYETLCELLAKHCSVSTGEKYGYTDAFVTQAKSAFYSLVTRMEEAREQQVPEEESFVVPADDEKVDIDKVGKELQEDLDETLRLQAYLHGSALLHKISVLLYHLATTVSTPTTVE